MILDEANVTPCYGTQTIVDTLCAGKAQMFTSDERDRLELFCRVCDGASGSRFVKTFHCQPQHIFMGRLADGTVVDEYPRYDDDDLRAFLTHYRKLRRKGERTELFAIIKLLKSKMTESERKMLNHLKNEIRQEGRCWWGSMHPGEGYTKSLTQERLEDLILNGEVFHSDIEKRNDFARIGGKMPLPKAVALLNYMRFARTVLACAQRVATLIREREYLTHT